MEGFAALKLLQKRLVLGLYCCCCFSFLLLCAFYTYSVSQSGLFHPVKNVDFSLTTIDHAQETKDAVVYSGKPLPRTSMSVKRHAKSLRHEAGSATSDDLTHSSPSLKKTPSGDIAVNETMWIPDDRMKARSTSTAAIKDRSVYFDTTESSLEVEPVLVSSQQASVRIANQRPFDFPSSSLNGFSAMPTDSTCTSKTAKPKLILLWTPFFSSWDYFPRGPFSGCSRCPNCAVTRNRSRIAESDAVIFHARDMSVADIPLYRTRNQRWIFYCLESPSYSDFAGLQFMHRMFNWTMTYRKDSDIVTQYGSFEKAYPKRRFDKAALRDVWDRKTKSVVWMVSHCPTRGGRDEYVTQLKKYVDVDVYGGCGTLDCPRGSTEQCLENFAATYKFFLAFENSICKDYVTEKFFRTLRYDIIPVVFGGANYRKHAPPGSYIDALAFKSPKHLAYFLSGVGKDFSLYSSYFGWRKDYVVKMESKKECAVCSLLHDKNAKQGSYDDLRKWWVQDGRCRIWDSKG